MEVLLAACRRETIDARVESIEGAELEAKIMDVEAYAMERAFSLMKKPRQWRPMLQQCMGADFSWSRAAHHYAELYQELLDFEFED